MNGWVRRSAGVNRGMVALAALWLWTVGCKAESHTKRMEFGNLVSADRIEVRAPFDKKVATITDSKQIQEAARFIARFSDGWTDSWSGPRAPMLMFDFYSRKELLGSFGIATSYLTAGVLSRDAPAAEIESVTKALGLQWPPRE